jgi:glycosyltransferase involved in cell wall biosynthesis
MSDSWPRIVLLIPALNEEATLPAVLADLPTEMIEEVVVIDNGSADRTAQVARASGATVLSEPRRGYEVACLAGISMDAVEQQALARVRQGEPFAAICTALESFFPPEDVVREVSSLLVRWIDDGLLAQLSGP